MQENMIFNLVAECMNQGSWVDYWTNLHSTSKTKVALEGIVGGAPLTP